MTQDISNKPVVLTIAGFDPSGGAGIIADIRTIESFGCVAAAAITSVTYQNAEKFFGAIHQTPESVRAQIDAILGGAEIAAIKIGMLPTAEIVREVACLLSDLNLPAPVIDPVRESTTGTQLMSIEAFEQFVTELMPLARLVTPNIPESEKLSGMNISDEEQMRQAAGRIRALGARAVLIKGGHLGQRGSSPTVWEGSKTESGAAAEAIDLLDDGGHVTVFRADWIEAPSVRGTGCMLSSAIASSLAQGADLEEAVTTARQFVADRIRASKFQLTTDD